MSANESPTYAEGTRVVVEDDRDVCHAATVLGLADYGHEIYRVLVDGRERPNTVAAEDIRGVLAPVTGDDVRRSPVFAALSDSARETIARNADASDADTRRALAALDRFFTGARVAGLRAKLAGTRYGVARVHSGTEDGYLWQTTRDGIALDVAGSGAIHEETALMDAIWYAEDAARVIAEDAAMDARSRAVRDNAIARREARREDAR